MKKIIFCGYFLTVVSCVSSTNWRGVWSSLSSCSKSVITSSSRWGCGKSRKRLEIQPQLTNVISNFLDGEATRSCTASSVRAWVSRISDVCRVCWDCRSTCGGGDDAADSETCCTVAISRTTLWGTLRCCVTCSICRAGACTCALLIWKLNNREQGKCLWKY